MNELTGKVVFFAEAKQFGFIEPDDGSDDVYFRLSDYDDARDPVADTKVAFMLDTAPKRPGQKRAAKAVTPISGQS